MSERMDTNIPHKYIYTQELSDGKMFAQGIVYRGDKSPTIVCQNPSLEVYSNDRLYWCSQTSKAITKAMNADGIKLHRGFIFELLHNSPKNVLEYQQCL